jgi:hypothetical protein
MNADQTEELERVHRQAVADGMVKVGLPMTDRDGCVEWCFAHRLSPTLARIDNVPVFCDEVHFGDVVEYREQDPPHPLFKDFVRVRTRGSTTLVVPYCDEDVRLEADEYRRRFSQVRDQLLALPEPTRPLAVEGVYEGWLAMALPLGLKRRQVRDVVVVACPWQAEG